ncbi:tripartite tricarboxylate transporter substrate-binding protein [Bradyrhizobium sp. LHD-71]|uniref:Bug family tripartite tricarboxylate transporter substrate binding protein n=1 Tax=Bradyrhizobium sp. LHD-71 TaxID=3072141 RepID=UPI00280F26F5|nr:tripartite tricarboxylate transporter substrate-binding protein [Bradyrhizobium sp. LHD-71]MDQ8728213.1 tripartite tricarboxylate transporter substrate-binding protein [Bradyrhizobium sp. LHD-71]
MLRNVLLAVAAACIGVSAASAQGAGANFPSKPIRVIVPFPPGQSADIIVRLLADKIKKQSGATVVVENKPGGNAIIGASEAARARPDGYTLLMAGTTAMSAAASMNANLPYDPVKSFTPVTGVALNSYVLVVKPDYPANSVQDIVELARKSPGKLSFGSGNQSSRMAAELFKTMTGVELLHIPYQGTEQAMSDLVNGQITMMFNGVMTSNPYLKRKDLKALGVSSQAREPELPDVPVIGDTVAGYSFIAWQGLVAPAGVPRETVATLNRLFTDALKDGEIYARLNGLGMTVWPVSQEELGKVIAEDKVKWRMLVTKAGIPVVQ